MVRGIDLWTVWEQWNHFCSGITGVGRRRGGSRLLYVTAARSDVNVCLTKYQTCYSFFEFVEPVVKVECPQVHTHHHHSGQGHGYYHRHAYATT